MIGSMGVLADTSERQRRCYNEVFSEHGIPLEWSQAAYQELLKQSGGCQRVAAALDRVESTADAAEIHRGKASRFQEDIRKNGVTCRPGVAETIREAKEQGLAIAFVTTTDRSNLDAILDAAPEVDADDFDLILHQHDVTQRKPDAEVYRLACDKLGVSAGECVAVEDNVDGLASAVAAGIRCYAFPGENNKGHDFSHAAAALDRLRASAVLA